MRLPYEKHEIYKIKKPLKYNKPEIFLTFTTWKLDCTTVTSVMSKSNFVVID